VASLRRGAATFTSGLAILFFRASLKTLGFGRTLGVYRRLAKVRTATAEVPSPRDERVRAVEESISSAAALFPGRAGCLERSLSMGLLLRWRRVPAEIKIGVQPFPFYAHAWVEVAGERLNTGDVWATGLPTFNLDL
jgi:hypothetical protein